MTSTAFVISWVFMTPSAWPRQVASATRGTHRRRWDVTFLNQEMDDKKYVSFDPDSSHFCTLYLPQEVRTAKSAYKYMILQDEI